MAILNMFGGGSGVRIPLEAPTGLILVPKDSYILISWTDPVDKYATPGGELVSKWAYSVLVRKEGSAPTSPYDGVQVVRTTTRDQYKAATYSDSGLTNGVTYYYGVFAYNTIGVASEGLLGYSSPVPGTPKYYTAKKRTNNDVVRSTAASTSNHVVIFGGLAETSSSSNKYVTAVRTFNASLTEGSATGVSTGAANAPSGSLNGHAFFFGGENGYSFTKGASDRVYKYSPSLTVSQGHLSTGKVGAGVAASANHIFAGGGCIHSTDSYDRYNTVDVFDLSMTRTSAAALKTSGPDYWSGLSIGNYAVITGGPSRYLDAYDDSLTKVSTTAEINWQRTNEIGCATIGPYGLIAGGDLGISYDSSNLVECFDGSLTKQTLTSLSYKRGPTVGCSFKGFALFVGGYNSAASYPEPSYITSADCYDSNLTRISTIDIPENSVAVAREMVNNGKYTNDYVSSSGVVGDYAIFTTGYNSPYVSGIHVFNIE